MKVYIYALMILATVYATDARSVLCKRSLFKRDGLDLAVRKRFLSHVLIVYLIPEACQIQTNSYCRSQLSAMNDLALSFK